VKEEEITQDEPRGSVLRGLFLGLGINLAVTVALFAPLALNDSYGRFALFPVVEWFALLGSATGITQVLWIFPRAVTNYYSGRTATTKGLAIAAAITLVLNVAGWYVFFAILALMKMAFS
jgi:hypothetical protein